jgi:hypothetical protein
MLGDLPLAIVDAAGHLLQTGTDIGSGRAR